MMTVTKMPRAIEVEPGLAADRCNFCPAERSREDAVYRDSTVYVLRLIRETEDKPEFYEFRACGDHLDRLAVELFQVALERGT